MLCLKLGLRSLTSVGLDGGRLCRILAGQGAAAKLVALAAGRRRQVRPQALRALATLCCVSQGIKAFEQVSVSPESGPGPEWAGARGMSRRRDTGRRVGCHRPVERAAEPAPYAEPVAILGLDKRIPGPAAAPGHHPKHALIAVRARHPPLIRRRRRRRRPQSRPGWGEAAAPASRRVSVGRVGDTAVRRRDNT